MALPSQKFGRRHRDVGTPRTRDAERARDLDSSEDPRGCGRVVGPGDIESWRSERRRRADEAEPSVAPLLFRVFSLRRDVDKEHRATRGDTNALRCEDTTSPPSSDAPSESGPPEFVVESSAIRTLRCAQGAQEREVGVSGYTLPDRKRRPRTRRTCPPWP